MKKSRKNEQEHEDADDPIGIAVDEAIEKHQLRERQHLEIVDEAVRFVLHSLCLASIKEGQAGDRAAKLIVDRVAQRMSEAPQEQCPFCGLTAEGFTPEEVKANMEHALLHLRANKIKDGCGWYSGPSRSKFCKRHVKALAFLQKILKKE